MARTRRGWLPTSEFSQREQLRLFPLRLLCKPARVTLPVVLSVLTGNSGNSTGKTRGLGTAMSAVAALQNAVTAESHNSRCPWPPMASSVSSRLPSTYIPSLGLSPEPGADGGPVNPAERVNLGLQVPPWHPCRRFSLLKKGLNAWTR